MKRLMTVIAVALCLFVGASAAQAFYGYDLDRAHRMRDRGDFWAARQQYRAMADDYYTDQYIRRQAAYFVGFCSIRLNEAWNAIEDYRRFLRTFDNSNTTLIPDALFVLGRTYENVGSRNEAIRCYRDCIRRFGYGEFPSKCQERLRILGDYYAGGNNGGYNNGGTYNNGGYNNGGYNPGHHGQPGHGGHHGQPGPVFSMETVAAAAPAAATPAVAPETSKQSGTDPFVGFAMELRNDKTDQLQQKFEELHQKP